MCGTGLVYDATLAEYEAAVAPLSMQQRAVRLSCRYWPRFWSFDGNGSYG